MNVAPTKNVSAAVAVSAAIGLVGWVVSEATGLVIPPEAIGWLTTLIVGAIAYAQRSAKVTAGAMASALVGLIVWVTGQIGVEVPPSSVAYLNTVSLFIFAWITTEFVETQEP